MISSYAFGLGGYVLAFFPSLPFPILSLLYLCYQDFCLFHSFLAENFIFDYSFLTFISDCSYYFYCLFISIYHSDYSLHLSRSFLYHFYFLDLFQYSYSPLLHLFYLLQHLSLKLFSLGQFFLLTCYFSNSNPVFILIYYFYHFQHLLGSYFFLFILTLDLSYHFWLVNSFLQDLSHLLLANFCLFYLLA